MKVYNHVNVCFHSNILKLFLAVQIGLSQFMALIHCGINNSNIINEHNYCDFCKYSIFVSHFQVPEIAQINKR